jgi:tungstate transport system permease protein
MTSIIDVFSSSLSLILSGDRVLFAIILRSIAVSGLATLLAAGWSIPIAVLIGLKSFRGRFLVKSLFNTLMGVPTVALGLILYLLLSRSGPLGFLHLLYTPTAMIIGQSLLITPLLISFVTNSIESVEPEIKELALTLGASEIRVSITVLTESLSSTILAITSGFNRAIAELGVALMVGGNIRNLTRVLTTTIALETSRGELSLSIALAIILLLIVGVLSFSINLIQRDRE